MASVRFVHAADVHLDAPFKGVDAADSRVRDALVGSTYRALDAVVDACLQHGADFLILAGDVYNHAEKSLRAQFAFRDACERLDEAGVPVFVARGNHDPSCGWSAGLSMPGNVRFFSDHEVERVAFEREGDEVCALYGRSFRTVAETDNYAVGFKRSKKDRLAIGVLHTNVGGRTDYEPYAPCSLDDLRSAAMDYWALGHIHKPEVLSEAPPVVYAGCLQGLDPSDTGIRGCRVVDLDEHGAAAVFVPTSAVVWDRADVDAGPAQTLDDVRASLADEVEEIRRRAEGRPAVVRLALTGRSAAHEDLVRPGVLRDMLAEVRSDALDREPWVWVDRVDDRTRPQIDVASVRSQIDFAGDLVRHADELLDDPDRAAALIEDIARPLLSALDACDVPTVDAASLLERARDHALDRLLAEEGL